jgi:Carboxypeptidase regulatory-like domain
MLVRLLLSPPGPLSLGVGREEVQMRLRLIITVLLATMLLLCSGCKKKSEPSSTVPKGYGVLTVLVGDESGKPIEGAQVTIANKMAEQFMTKTDGDGRTKGAGQVSLSPFSVFVAKAGYDSQQKEGITLSESLPAVVMFQLKRSKA